MAGHARREAELQGLEGRFGYEQQEKCREKQRGWIAKEKERSGFEAVLFFVANIYIGRYMYVMAFRRNLAAIWAGAGG